MSPVKRIKKKKTRCKIAKGFFVAKDSRLKEPKNIQKKFEKCNFFDPLILDL